MYIYNNNQITSIKYYSNYTITDLAAAEIMDKKLPPRLFAILHMSPSYVAQKLFNTEATWCDKDIAGQNSSAIVFPNKGIRSLIAILTQCIPSQLCIVTCSSPEKWMCNGLYGVVDDYVIIDNDLTNDSTNDSTNIEDYLDENNIHTAFEFISNELFTDPTQNAATKALIKTLINSPNMSEDVREECMDMLSIISVGITLNDLRYIDENEYYRQKYIKECKKIPSLGRGIKLEDIDGISFRIVATEYILQGTPITAFYPHSVVVDSQSDKKLLTSNSFPMCGFGSLTHGIYDPERDAELDTCAQWVQKVCSENPYSSIKRDSKEAIDTLTQITLAYLRKVSIDANVTVMSSYSLPTVLMAVRDIEPGEVLTAGVTPNELLEFDTITLDKIFRNIKDNNSKNKIKYTTDSHLRVMLGFV